MIASDAARLALARTLLGVGAGQSARNVLGSLRGAEANRVRLAASEVRLRPGIYCLVTLPDGVGAALPLRPVYGHPRATDRAFREACVVAYEHARTILEDRSLPMLRFELEEELAVFGSSIGLPAALAFLAFYAPSRAPIGPVLATGELLHDGRLGHVGQLEAKYTIARAEKDALAILLPRARTNDAREGANAVGTFDEARTIVFGDRPLRLDVLPSNADALIHRARVFALAADSVALLESVDRATLTDADRARVLFDLGTYHRNLGMSREAFRLHSEARALLVTERHVLGEEAAERYELECWATELDRYHLEEVTNALAARLDRPPFLKLRNELRCRGMLAQGLAMMGRFDDAVRVRSDNLALHDRSDGLGKVRPATLCHLVLDSGLGGDAATFDRVAVALVAATRPGDEDQWRFNATAIVRGLVALGRYEDALSWSRDERDLFECRAPATLVVTAKAEAARVSAPEISGARALVRAMRRLGRPHDAIALGRHTMTAAGDTKDLFGWMTALTGLELGLALHDAGDHAADAQTRESQAMLDQTHPEATRFHSALLAVSAREREIALDRVWY